VSIDKRMVAKIAGGGVAALAATAIAAAPSALANPAAPAPPAPDTVTQAAPGPVPHLYNPNNLPPGTSANPVDGTESAGVSYARQVWEAIQEHDISWGQGLILLAQRPMDPNATPPAGLAAGPQQPGPNPPPPPP
jgi:resuscitation-promoting factor RpfA